jgi:outer membrane protein OmpA-like peptidoglycan-associated protein
MNIIVLRKVSLGILLLTLVLIAGCAGMTYSPQKGVLFVHAELVQADQAIANAQQAGKATACPTEFATAQKKREDAFDMYWKCRTDEAIALAKEAMTMANALCPPVVRAAPPPPPPAPVLPPPPPPPPAMVNLEVFFDTDKAVIKPESFDRIEEFANFLKAHPELKAEIQGHTDSDASDQYNMGLSQRRADAVRNALIERYGIAPDRLTAKGFGETQPIASNATPEGKAKNRRIQARIIR